MRERAEPQSLSCLAPDHLQATRANPGLGDELKPQGFGEKESLKLISTTFQDAFLHSPSPKPPLLHKTRSASFQQKSRRNPGNRLGAHGSRLPEVRVAAVSRHTPGFALRKNSRIWTHLTFKLTLCTHFF